jgi:hypothetical protein
MRFACTDFTCSEQAPARSILYEPLAIQLTALAVARVQIPLDGGK